LRILATAHAKNDGLYNIVIRSITIRPISLIDEEEVCMEVWTGDLEEKHRNMATKLSLDTSTKLDL
jgi:hypothetical protein